MFPRPKLEREGDGRYDVYVSSDSGEKVRLGTALGGKRKWFGECHQESFGPFRSRESAAECVVRIAAPPRGIRVRDTLEEFFEKHPYKDEYHRMFGKEAFPRFISGNYAAWLDCNYPRSANIRLSLEETHAIGAAFAQLPGVDARNIVQRLVIGEREERWTVPAIEGVLTPEYWDGLESSADQTPSPQGVEIMDHRDYPPHVIKDLDAGFVITDEDDGFQRMRKESAKRFEFRAEVDGTTVVATIDLNEIDAAVAISGFYDSVDEVYAEYGDDAPQIIAECAFEHLCQCADTPGPF